MEEIKLQQFKEKLELLGYSQRAINDYPAQMRLFLRYLEENEGVSKVNDITAEHITAYHSYLQCGRLHRGKHLSPATVQVGLAIIKKFFQVMYREHLIAADLSGTITLPKARKDLPHHVPSEQDMNTLLDAMEPCNALDIRDRAMLELLYATGLRNQEIRTLAIDSIDFTEKTLFVTGKGSKDRVVPLGEWVIPYLKEYLETARRALLQPKKPTDLLFISKNGRQLSEGSLNYILRKRTGLAGVSRIKPHSVRHACATHMLRAGADIRYVQELLGHAELSTTQIYTKVEISFLKQAHQKYHPREKTTPDEH
jgi:integrase/recombinase XerD